jgi:hypothetical protein
MLDERDKRSDIFHVRKKEAENNETKLEDKKSGSYFESIMNVLAFPENHISFPKIGFKVDEREPEAAYDASVSYDEGRDEVELLNVERETSNKDRSASEPSSFETMMDYVAFQEKHLACPAMDACAAPQIEYDVACPTVESCPAPNIEDQATRSIQQGNDAFDKVMDYVAFPEKHVTCPRIIPEQDQHASKSKRSAAKSKRKDRDVLDDVFEHAESQWCVQKSKHVNSLLVKERDVLDYVFENVESSVCSDDTSSEHIEEVTDRRGASKVGTYIKRGNRLMDSSNLPKRGDELMASEDINSRSWTRKSNRKESPQENKVDTKKEGDALVYVFENLGSIRSNDEEDESARSNSLTSGENVPRQQQDMLDQVCNSFEDELCHGGDFDPEAKEKLLQLPGPPSMDAPTISISIPSNFATHYDSYGVRRDRSLLSESSISTMDMSRDPRNEARNTCSVGMEMVLGPSRETPKRRKRRNFLSRVFGSRRSRNAPTVLKKSNRKPNRSIDRLASF